MQQSIGPHVFGQGEEVDEGIGVEENRQQLQDLLLTNRLVLANTLFYKQPEGLITFKLDNTAKFEPPYNRQIFATIDYTIIQQKWKDNIKDTYSDMRSGIDTDHFPVTSVLKVALKAKYRNAEQRLRF